MGIQISICMKQTLHVLQNTNWIQRYLYLKRFYFLTYPSNEKQLHLPYRNGKKKKENYNKRNKPTVNNEALQNKGYKEKDGEI